MIRFIKVKTPEGYATIDAERVISVSDKIWQNEKSEIVLDKPANGLTICSTEDREDIVQRINGTIGNPINFGV
jgi:hypothetical protein